MSYQNIETFRRLVPRAHRRRMGLHASDGCAVGLDVSVYQGDVPWKEVVSLGFAYAIVRASIGLAPIDAKFQKNFFALGPYCPGPNEENRIGKNILPGSYHFALPNVSRGRDQAIYHCKLAPVMSPRALPPMLDIENAGGLSPAQLLAWTREFVQTTVDTCGRYPIIYVGGPFWSSEMGNLPAPDLGEKCATMLPAYTRGPSPRYFARPWKERKEAPLIGPWDFWQYDGDGGQRLPSRTDKPTETKKGTDSDFSLCRGDRDDLDLIVLSSFA